MTIKYLIPAAALAACGAQAALAQSTEGQLEVTVLAQSEFSPRGTFQYSGAGQLDDLAAVSADLAGNPATTTLRRRSFHDLLSAGAGLGVELGFAATPNLDAFVRLSYGELRGRNSTLADIASPALVVPATLNANVSDWRATDFSLGTRYYLGDSGPLRPFVEGYLGAIHSGALRADLSAGDAGIVLGSNTLLPSTTRFTTGISGGASYQFIQGSNIRFSIGTDYIAAQRYQSVAYAPLGLTTVAVGDRQWSLAADIGFTYRM
jgi:hypothetical protein